MESSADLTLSLVKTRNQNYTHGILQASAVTITILYAKLQTQFGIQDFVKDVLRDRVALAELFVRLPSPVVTNYMNILETLMSVTPNVIVVIQVRDISERHFSSE